MKNSSYRLRWRGKTSGPYDLETLKGMLSCGEISLLHQVQTGGVWICIEEILGAASPVSTCVAPTIAPEVEAPVPVPGGPPPIPPETTFYILKDGRKQGPHTSSVVRQLADAGVLSPDDLARREGEQDWRPLSVFFAFNQTQMIHPQNDSASNAFPEAALAPNTRRRAGKNNMAAGIAAVALFQSNEIRKELQQLNESVDKMQEDAGSGAEGGFDFSGF